MIPSIVRDATVMTLLGGGEAPAPSLRNALERAPILVAADGGADRALALGYRPELAIGDMDSISAAARQALGPDRMLHIAEQDSTDFEKSLRSLPDALILGVGFTGARLDHTLAAMTALARNAHRRVLLLGARDLVFHCPPTLRLDLPEGSRLSLYPMQPVAGRSIGLEWPIEGIGFAPAGRTGTSNRTTEGTVELTMDGPGMLVILPARMLDIALAALRDTPPWS